jgi:hypothetical protein
MRVQFQIHTLIAAAVVIAIALGALRNPSPAMASMLFTIAFALPLAAVVKAVASRGEKRLPWIGCCVFGLGFLHVSFNLPQSDFVTTAHLPPPEPVVSVGLATAGLPLNPEVQGLIESERSTGAIAALEAPRMRRTAYLNSCASIGAIVMAALGGLFGGWVARQARAAQAAEPSSVT